MLLFRKCVVQKLWGNCRRTHIRHAYLKAKSNLSNNNGEIKGVLPFNQQQLANQQVKHFSDLVVQSYEAFGLWLCWMTWRVHGRYLYSCTASLNLYYLLKMWSRNDAAEIGQAFKSLENFYLGLTEFFFYFFNFLFFFYSCFHFSKDLVETYAFYYATR